MAQNFSDLPTGAQVVSVPQNLPSTTPSHQQNDTQAQQFSDIPSGAQIVSVPNAAVSQGTSYQAVPDESTPEGHAAAVAQREREHPIITDVGKGSGEALGDIWDSVKSMVTHPVDTAGGLIGSGNETYQHIKDSIPILHSYEDARSQGKGVIESLTAANNKAKEISDAHSLVKQRMEEFKKQPGVATIRALGNAATIAATVYDGGKLLTELPETAAPETEPTTAAPESEPTAQQPGLIKQIVKGEKVAQPGAKAAIRGAIQDTTDALSDSDEPIIEGNQTIVDKHLSALKSQEADAYKKIDDSAGFDVNAEKQQLANDKYKLKQLGNTDADVTQRGNLIESINDSEQRIADAESKMKEAGIDPAEADSIHRQRMAGSDFKKILVKNTNPDGSVNVDGLLKASKTLRFTKYGDRLEQFFGSNDAAENYMSELDRMQKLGAHAIKMQNIAKWLGKIGLTATGLTAGGTVLHYLAE